MERGLPLSSVVRHPIVDAAFFIALTRGTGSWLIGVHTLRSLIQLKATGGCFASAADVLSASRA